MPNRNKEWRVCVGLPDYEVSELGDIRRINDSLTYKAGFVLRGQADKDGYRRVTLRQNGKQTWRHIHRLVIEAFVSSRPSPSHQVAHWDGVRTNNTVGNLRWATCAENQADVIRHKTRQGERHGRAKLSDSIVTYARKKCRSGATLVSLSRKFGVTPVAMRLAVRGINWRHVSEPPVPKKWERAHG
jgi:hypothetical protein